MQLGKMACIATNPFNDYLGYLLAAAAVAIMASSR